MFRRVLEELYWGTRFINKNEFVLWLPYQFICNKKKLSWSLAVSDSILLSFKFYAALFSRSSSGVYALWHVVRYFQILSFRSVRWENYSVNWEMQLFCFACSDLVSRITPLLSLDYENWIILSSLLLHNHFESLDSSEKRKRCKQVGNDKLLDEVYHIW